MEMFIGFWVIIGFAIGLSILVSRRKVDDKVVEGSVKWIADRSREDSGVLDEYYRKLREDVAEAERVRKKREESISMSNRVRIDSEGGILNKTDNVSSRGHEEWWQQEGYHWQKEELERYHNMGMYHPLQDMWFKGKYW